MKDRGIYTRSIGARAAMPAADLQRQLIRKGTAYRLRAPETLEMRQGIEIRTAGSHLVLVEVVAI